ncbi:reverse transcriptase-like protein [Phycicoccus sp. CSK15P-2]|uniref:reverse transcriptase-like protein n=1 Tax=Phycicoccus sp. CSK15P-2 TaxID=2807627 RepID=UPI001951B318|nr:reverse transcriptase-like protein [Phycicoccus sp. CSK15P-2]MBM6403649.1 reverse transcriptase-like protein [Phycicoccus sp. CSK15P-2]MBM6405114.1 reverse transcriptase-like protein [Phycicoccus sp. CSK15P-2]
MSRRLTVEADGGSRGNPGVAGYGALVRDGATGALLAERAEPLGKASNNVAEYRGLIAGLEAAYAIEPGADVVVRMDSKLVVEQMSGTWKIKHEDMKRLALRARDVAAAIRTAGGSVRYEWIPRAENSDADALSNDGMDGLTVDRRHDDVGSEAEDGEAAACDPATVRSGTPVRVVLVAEATGAASRTAAQAVERLLGGAPRRLLTAPGEASVETAAEVGDALGVDPVVDAGWDVGVDPADAWGRVVGRGGTTVVVCPPDTVRAVLGHVLGMPAGRSGRLAVAPGSLAGVEVWAGDDVSVAFTNRT